MDAVKWNKRASFAYAVGIWTMFGCYGYYSYKHRNDPPVPIPVQEEEEKPNVKKTETKHSKTTIVYKENFVPYSTRIINFFTSAKDSSGERQEKEK